MSTDTDTTDSEANDSVTDAGDEPVATDSHGDPIDPAHEDPAHGDHAHGASDFQYVVIAAILAGITGLEVLVSYIDIGPLFLPVLLTLMAIKFVTVVSFFMHLKFDNKIFSVLFYGGLLLAIFVYVVALSTFHFFS
jgi:cytochrome c oxidase subunit 4